MQSPFFEKRLLITGGSKGIGRSIAEAFLKEGAKVAVCARSPMESPPSNKDRKALFYSCDVRDPDQCEDLVAKVAAQFGGLDILINNAGGSPPAQAASASPRFSEAIVKLNLLGPIYTSKAANTIMQAQEGGGVIINIASVSGIRPSPGTAVYGAAKAGLLSLTSSLAIEWAPKVRVTSLTLGLIETEKSSMHYGDASTMKKVAATVPMGRMGCGEDAASACLFLASDKASYLTGSGLRLDGGGESPAFLKALS